MLGINFDIKLIFSKLCLIKTKILHAFGDRTGCGEVENLKMSSTSVLFRDGLVLYGN